MKTWLGKKIETREVDQYTLSLGCNNSRMHFLYSFGRVLKFKMQDKDKSILMAYNITWSYISLKYMPLLIVPFRNESWFIS